ncbi:hypothetical protein MTO96_031699 [Rhipicephalus appendiculatus]
MPLEVARCTTAQSIGQQLADRLGHRQMVGDKVAPIEYMPPDNRAGRYMGSGLLAPVINARSQRREPALNR